jgi:hypothetical protein|tara:strand:+ start:3752 stop:4546 length:795 start_codon:yes stop_codon:yes gene_type:complete
MKPTNLPISSKKIVSLIAGNGEVGGSLYRILLWKKNHQVYMIDKEEEVDIKKINVLHICFPYSKKFDQQVKEYQAKYNPQYTVIHSTVPISTSIKLMAHHSPLRGVHPVLDKSLWTFKKYLAPKSTWLKKYFEEAGIEIIEVDNPNDTEAGKLWSTTQYGWSVILEKLIYEFCKENGLNFDIVYRSFNESYNDGYDKMGMKHVRRPVLHHSEGEIGGHCVIPNLELFNTPINDFIKVQNDRLKVRKVRPASSKSKRGRDWRVRG